MAKGSKIGSGEVGSGGYTEVPENMAFDKPMLNTPHTTYDPDHMEVESVGKMTNIDINEGAEMDHKKGLTAFEGSLALLSVIVGGGIVGLPYANYTSGLTFGVALNIISPILAFTSGYLFMTCKLMAPIKIETLYELGYFTMGKCSIYFISFIAIVCNQGFCIIYFIVFGQCAQSIAKDLIWPNSTNIATTYQFWVFVLAIGLLPIIFKKVLAEMKIISYALFGSVLLFVFFLAFQLANHGMEKENPDTPPYHYWNITWGWNSIAAFSVFLCAYNFSFIEFPLYHALGPDRCKTKMLWAIGLGMVETTLIYMSCGILGVYLFGSVISDNVLENIDGETTVVSFIIRFSFLIVLACHVPYVFFLGKEGACIVVDELMTKSMSKSLQKRMDPDEPELDSEVIVYHNMNKIAYIITTLLLYALCVIVACLTTNLGALFNYIAAFSVSGIQFFVPGMSIIILSRNHPGRDTMIVFLGYFYVVGSVFVTLSIFFDNIYESRNS